MEPSEYTPLPRESHEYVDGLLGSEAERDFERRLLGNPELKQRIDEMQAARKLLASVAMVDPPADFDAGVFERLKYVDLANSAREKLLQARTPIWQRFAQVAVGAVAASVALVLIGLPSTSTPTPEYVLDGGPISANLLPVSSVSEADVMPLFADQYDRYREMQRHVLFAQADNADARRDLVRAELELSDVLPRCRRLESIVRSLPEPERREYVRFFDTLASCCESIDAELVKSRNERRELSMQALNASLAGVYIPARLSSEGAMLVTRFGPAGSQATPIRVSVGSDAELALYLQARGAFYQRDYEGAWRHYEDYLARYPKGRFGDCARSGCASALLRAGDSDRALDRYLADVSGNANCLPLIDSADQALFRQAQNERARRAPAPLPDEDK